MHRAKVFACVSVGLSLLAPPRVVWSEPPPQFLTMWGTLGAGPGQFNGPAGIAVDAAGFVYVTDQWNYRVCKFTAEGQFVLAWGSVGGGPGQFRQMAGVATDNLGRVMVVDYENHRIEVFTPDGQFLAQWGGIGPGPGQLFYPRDIAVSADGIAFVADYGNHRIVKFDGNGSFLGEFGIGQVSQPTGVAVDAAGSVYVCDEAASYNGVAKFEASGSFVMRWGGTGREPGQFAGPGGLDTDHNGDLFVTDHGNSRIQKFTPDGSLLSYWGSTGTGPGQFNVTLDVAIGPDGSVFVTDVGNQRVQKFGYLPVAALEESWGGVKARYR